MRSGQGAFGNMCRKGRMFSPTKIWRRWHRKINVNQKRYAVASALAASAVPALVMARGHRISRIPEVPLVLTDKLESVKRTKDAVAVLKRIRALGDIQRVSASRKLRTGHGKYRNRRYVERKGPLIVYNKDQGITRAFRNIPGVDLANVSRLNLLQLAPGGHLGRFVIWTESAFNKLNALYGTLKTKASLKGGYRLPRPVMNNADLERIINSDEVQSRLRPKKKNSRTFQLKKNPLKNLQVLLRLNPYAKTLRRQAILAETRKAVPKKNGISGKARKLKSKARLTKINANE